MRLRAEFVGVPRGGPAQEAGPPEDRPGRGLPLGRCHRVRARAGRLHRYAQVGLLLQIPLPVERRGLRPCRRERRHGTSGMVAIERMPVLAPHNDRNRCNGRPGQ